LISSSFVSGLPEPIKRIIGNLDLAEDTKMFPEMRKKLKDPSTSTSILTHYLQPTVQVLSVSETRLYPLAQYLLMAGGMNFQNNFHITTHDDTANKLEYNFGAQKLTAILDIAAWFNSVGGKVAFGSKIE